MKRAVFISLGCAVLACVGCGEPQPRAITVSVPRADGLHDAYVWQPLAPLPEPRFEMGAATVDGKFYVLGGFTEKLKSLYSVIVYDPATNEWSQVADMPTNTTHMNVVRDDRDLWYAGGFAGDNPGSATDEVWRFNVDTKAFTPGPSLPEAIGAGPLCIVDRELHFIGGLLSDRVTDSPAHWALNIDTGTQWESRAPIPQAKNHHSAAVVDGLIYVFGGELGHDQVHFEGPWHDVPDMHRYDPATDAWTKLRDLPTPLSHVEPSCFVVNGHIVVIGGRTGHYDVADAWAYSPNDDEWTPLPPIPEPGRGVAAVLIGDAIYIAGGRYYRSPVSANVWKGPLTLSWKQILQP